VTFTGEQQKQHRKQFINECRQRAWAAACHADLITKQLDTLLADYSKLKAEDDRLVAEIKALENSADAHTEASYDKRKTLQERRNGLSAQMKVVGQNHEQGQKALGGLYQNIEASFQLAERAKTRECREIEAKAT
jgi:uncharacterized protein YlxW (UPF0749 family)